MIDTRFLRANLTVAAVVFLTAPFVPTQLEAQTGGRFRVIVTNLKPSDGSRANFGEDVSDELRDLLDLDRHVAMSDRDVDTAAREYQMRSGDLDCNTGVQLGAQIQVPLIFCGEYRTEGNNVIAIGKYIALPSTAEFVIEPAPVATNQPGQLAEAFRDFLMATADRLEQIEYCSQDFQSRNWEGALRYCQRAVELAPESKDSRLALAQSLMELQRHPEALAEFEILLEQDPYNIGVLESAGWLAAQMQQEEKARGYYGRFLELNPTNIPVRLQIAGDLSQGGDDIGAMALLEAGFEQLPNSPDLHLLYGAMAFRAASVLESERPRAAPTDPLDPEVIELYRTAVRSHSIVLDSLGAEMRPLDAINMVRAFMKIGDFDGAITVGERVVVFFDDVPQAHGELAVVYARAGRLDDALRATNRALELQPDYPDAHARLATYLLEANRFPEALEQTRLAIAANERDPDQLAQVLFVEAYSNRIQKGDPTTGMAMLRDIKALPGISDMFRSQVSFFQGYTIYLRAVPMEAPATLESAQASLPVFQEALPLLEQGLAWGRANNTPVAELIANANTYILRQETLIRQLNAIRGG